MREKGEKSVTTEEDFDFSKFVCLVGGQQKERKYCGGVCTRKDVEEGSESQLRSYCNGGPFRLGSSYTRGCVCSFCTRSHS